MGLVDEYFELDKTYQETYGLHTILLMQVGAFFEVYGKKANSSKIMEFTRICDLNIAEKNVCVGGESVIMAGFKENFIEKYLNKIQNAGYTTVVYVQDEQTKGTSRSLSGIFSPGTFFATDSQAGLTNNTVCIWIEYIEFTKNILSGRAKQMIEVGMSNLDIYTGKTSIFQFSQTYIKNNPITYDDLERFISIYNPNEVIVISNLSKNEVENILQYANVKTSAVHMVFLNEDSETKHRGMAKNCEKQIYQKEVLTRFYPELDFHTIVQRFYENNMATQSLCFLLDFVYQHNPFLVNKIAEPIFENVSERLILANHSLKQLNIIEDSTFHGKFSSVEKMLNVCITAMGKRAFNHLFLNPITDPIKLEREYAITDYLLSVSDTISTVFLQLNTIKDITKWTRQIMLKKIAPKIFYQMCDNLNTISQMFYVVYNDSSVLDYIYTIQPKFVNVAEYCETIVTFLNTRMIMSLCKDLDDMRDFEINFIQPAVDEELDKLNVTLTESMDQWNAIQSYFNLLIGSTEKKSKPTEFVKQHETEKNHLSLIATKRRCTLLKSVLKSDTDIVLSYTSSLDQKIRSFTFKCTKDTIIFTTQNASNNHISCPQMDLLCKTIYTVKGQMKNVISQIYLDLVTKMESYQMELDILCQFITTLDVLYAKTTIAKKYHLCKPILDTDAEKSFIDAKDLRHCLIENLNQQELYVANDIVIGKDSVNGILLYGTNAVGKTSFIRSLGIAVIMAQAGLYVPASQFKYKPYTSIFTRILGNDNIFKGLSTFAVEMSELRNILLMADKNSLILGDELCSGTESISAMSIFVSGIQHLHKMESSFLFATHLHEISSYSEITELEKVCLKHMVVHYDREKDLLVYDRKLRNGSGTNTYGLEVCKSLHLPLEFMENAHHLRMKYYPENASILSLKTSHYNSKKLVGLCEQCGVNMGEEVHHLQHQSNANSNGIIEMDGSGPFHKNHVANLITVCKFCHDSFHRVSSIEHKKVKTTKEMIVKPVTNKKLN